MGLQSGDAPELWNTEHPDHIANLHRSTVDAGADIILTNSFGGTRYRNCTGQKTVWPSSILLPHELPDRLLMPQAR